MWLTLPNYFYMPLPNLLLIRDKLDVKWGESQWGCHSDTFTLGTGPFQQSPPSWISYISKARGNPENIQREALTLQPSNPLPTNTPQAGSGSETRQLFMEQKGASYLFPWAFTWLGFVPHQHASVCVFAWTWLKESDRFFFPGQKSRLINPRLECEATLPEPFMHKAHCLGGICHQFLFIFFLYELRFLEVIH